MSDLLHTKHIGSAEVTHDLSCLVHDISRHLEGTIREMHLW
jgi:hypothetical protein